MPASSSRASPTPAIAAGALPAWSHGLHTKPQWADPIIIIHSTEQETETQSDEVNCPK